MISLDFVKAGNAIFTVNNDKDEHYTYEVIYKSGNNPIYFVFVLTGGDGHYSYMGNMNVGSITARPAGKSKFKPDSRAVRVFNFSMRIIAGKQELPKGYDIQHEGKCGACGRPLTDPESIKLGLGPVCRTKIHNHN